MNKSTAGLVFGKALLKLPQFLDMAGYFEIECLKNCPFNFVALQAVGIDMTVHALLAEVPHRV